MRPLFTALAVASACLLASCSTTYQAKPGEVPSQLRFVTFAANPSSVVFADVKACPGKSFLANENLTPPATLESETRLGMLGKAPSTARAAIELMSSNTDLPGAVMIFEPAVQGTMGFSCTFGFSFRTGAGLQYELQVRRDDRRCGAQLFRLEQREGEVRRTPDPTFRTFRSDYGVNMCFAA